MSHERIEIRMNAAPKGRQQWYWHWKAANNKIIATSGEPFYDRAACVKAVDRIIERLAKPMPVYIKAD